MKIDGGCHCGHITYEADVDPERVVICNCEDCQSLSGSAFRSVVFTTDNGFKLLSGEMKIYLKTGGSGNKRQTSFCPECGSSIYSTSEAGGPVYGIRLGSVKSEQRGQFVPTKRIFARSEQAWVDDLPSIPKVQDAS
jgi:hypothetical protein